MLRTPLAPTLRELAFTYAAGAAALVVLTIAIGGAGLVLWQYSSGEALRNNALVEEAQGMRGSLYRQMKEVFDAVFLEDSAAVSQYHAHESDIRTRLARLHQLADSAEERNAIARVEQAYAEIRTHTDGMLDNWVRYSLQEKRRILDTELEQGSLAGYERAFSQLEGLLDRQGRALQRRLALLAWSSPLLLALPVVGAAVLLLWSRRWMRRAIIEPLVSVQRATEEISRGDLTHRVPEVGAGELQRLAHSVNQMATDLAASRASLIRAEKEATLAALVPVVAHNIRNPLAAIRATAQVIDDGSLPADVGEGLQGIIATTDRLERWTHALLSYLNPLEPQRALCRAGTLVENMPAMLQPRLDQKRVRLDLTGFERDVPLNIDAQLVEQALHGLVVNAVEAAPEGGTVRVMLAREGARAEIKVEDDGAGIPFSPEPTGLRPGPSTKRFGTGLGIPFAVKVFDQHGGSVRFARAERGGTCVHISLPA
jgi:signal transduction histidine kinase